MKYIGLYVDDERKLPEQLQDVGWIRAHNFHEAITKLDLMEFEELSLDHDLASFYGYKEMTGMDIVNWLVQRKMNGLYVPSKIYVHSANIVGTKNMVLTIKQYLYDNP
jgi:hypothetical protein